MLLNLFKTLFKSEEKQGGDDFGIDAAMADMRSPYQMKIICVDVTNKCDLACSNCTRLLENQDGFWEMSVENFRLALKSLRDYPGIIAMIGGNPCMHTKFEELCKVFSEEIPEKSRRGLWTNNIFKHEAISVETFGVFNLNPHNVPRGIDSLKNIKQLGWYHPENSEHSSILSAVQDFYPEHEMWKLISACDINQQWSAGIVENNGVLRAYFCEVAAAFDLARKEDNGFPVTDGWWRNPVSHFKDQVAYFCPRCGVPARIGPVLDCDETDTYSDTNEELALKSASKKRPRKIIKITSLEDGLKTNHAVVEYSKKLRGDEC